MNIRSIIIITSLCLISSSGLIAQNGAVKRWRYVSDVDQKEVVRNWKLITEVSAFRLTSLSSIAGNEIGFGTSFGITFRVNRNLSIGPEYFYNISKVITYGFRARFVFNLTYQNELSIASGFIVGYSDNGIPNGSLLNRISFEAKLHTKYNIGVLMRVDNSAYVNNRRPETAISFGLHAGGEEGFIATLLGGLYLIMDAISKSR